MAQLISDGTERLVRTSVAVGVSFLVSKPANAIAEGIVTALVPAPVSVPAKVGVAVLQGCIAGTIVGTCSREATRIVDGALAFSDGVYKKLNEAVTE